MRISTKAAIYSGLVFPGAGYFFVNAKRRGGLAITTIIICLSVILYDTSHKAHIIAEKIASGSIPYDINIIREQIKVTPSVFNPDLITGLLFIIGIIWFFGIIDSYRLGQAMSIKIN